MEPFPPEAGPPSEREFFIDNLLVRIHFIIEMIWWTGLAPREFEFFFPVLTLWSGRARFGMEGPGSPGRAGQRAREAPPANQCCHVRRMLP